MSRWRPVLAALTASLLAGALAVAGAPAVLALDNGLARTPPMGFNDWNAVHCGVNEAFIEQTADLMVSSGLKAAGYQFVNIDDCWALANRDAAGNLVPDPAKFPDGIKGTADYVHARGLKLGLYNDSGTHTCSKSGFPGSLGHESQDARLFASWGVDYLKDDDCNIPTANQNRTDTIARYTAMRDALAASGRPIVFSICEKGDWAGDPASWSPAVGNLWRTTGDIHAEWTRIKSLIAANIPKAAAARPGAWNDPDMLEVGNPPPSGSPALTTTEQQTHFSMWAEMAAPLIIGTKLASASSTTMSILLNADVIAVDQDPLGRQGAQIANSGGLRVLAKPLVNGDRAVALYNETDSAATISTTAAAAGLPLASSYTLTDLWSKRTTSTSGSISASVPAHGTVLYRAHAPAGATTTYEAESAANTLSGGAAAASCSACSGGQRVRFVGHGGTLRFNGVMAAIAGAHALTIAYTDGDAGRSAQLSVNGGSPVTIDLPSTGSFSAPGTITVTVSLSAGSNTLTFSNPSAWAPDFDRVMA